MSHGAFLNSSGALPPPQGEVCWEVLVGSGKASSARPSELLDPALDRSAVYLYLSAFRRRPSRERTLLEENPLRGGPSENMHLILSAATFLGSDDSR